MNRGVELQSSFEQIQTRLRSAEETFNRPARSANLLAVSKTKPASDIVSLYHLGCRRFGENYVQEAIHKMATLTQFDIEWHYIGKIQSNKTHLIAQHFDWVHTLDRDKIAKRLNDARSAEPINILIQVNVDNAKNKSGVAPAALDDLVDTVLTLPRLKLRGLMSIPDPVSEESLANAHQSMKTRFDRIKARLPEPTIFDTLSMGMTNDLELAIKSGSTLVRIGTALFGQRPTKERS
ncbi:YggS family pyridoxal phosphate-dependent enzyme [Litorivicinus sp.]|jgi:pyridoxal phosphate enzyme (YggS family)|nr:YggS family pyridoxal phosphate-dependent enzyme [Litorivicinus sp.]|tara:strand:- start:15219 stop:15926 length:708 start_codon:yes stop_codon:yes gene_type:complete